ncbi:glycoside hydrolase family 16 protein [Myriangium duriaei CBS 260.36]|uniref:Crh-like protein n=1 Tax=Myriangium duriaei CBS 260.36 TaxID=1168546 RepID=A0A9P4JCP2_9PEZI|nr:glycoside hydrolase family 16 protein [Myriangium duriaei CBS 260.36]
MLSFSAVGALALALASVALADDQIKCSASSKCPESSPCCSSYGLCGVGAYCLGGCDPKSSFNLQSCMAAPVCSSGDFKMTSLDGIVANTEYLGDASTGNWVSSGKPLPYQDQSVLLTMPPNSVGTLLSSTHYVWYGKISATMTTSQGAGVVTAFIMMSDMKDEIDFEFVGVDLEHAQSNYYFQGITDYGNEMNLTVSNTVSNSHTYTIDWQPDQLTWSIDGNVLRTLKKSDTYNTTDKQYHYPQTPSRVQLSLWPAGLASNGQGTIDWSGGLVNWDSPYMANGYYYAQVFDVNVQCYDPPSDATKTGTKSYYYNNVLGIENTVVISNNNTILGSFQANGLNQQYNPNAKASGTASSSSSSSTPSSNANTVPGMSGAGSYSNSAQSSSSNSDSSSGSGTSSGQGSSSSGTSSSGGTFSQGGTSSTGEGTRVVAGSLVALVAFFAAVMMV